MSLHGLCLPGMEPGMLSTWVERKPTDQAENTQLQNQSSIPKDDTRLQVPATSKQGGSVVQGQDSQKQYPQSQHTGASTSKGNTPQKLQEARTKRSPEAGKLEKGPKETKHNDQQKQGNDLQKKQRGLLRGIRGVHDPEGNLISSASGAQPKNAQPNKIQSNHAKATQKSNHATATEKSTNDQGTSRVEPPRKHPGPQKGRQNHSSEYIRQRNGRLWRVPIDQEGQQMRSLIPPPPTAAYIPPSPSASSDPELTTADPDLAGSPEAVAPNGHQEATGQPVELCTLWDFCPCNLDGHPCPQQHRCPFNPGTICTRRVSLPLLRF